MTNYAIRPINWDLHGKRVNKCGNPWLSRCLVEIVWLLMKWNSGYKGIQKWSGELLSPKLDAARKERIVVAIARQFAVDWWRTRTGRATAEALGLLMKEESPQTT